MKLNSFIFIWFFGISLNCLGPNLCNGFLFSPDQPTKRGEQFKNKKQEIVNNVVAKNEEQDEIYDKGDGGEYGDRGPSKVVTPEQLTLNRKRILAENGIQENQDIAEYLLSSKKSSSFLKHQRSRSVRSASEEVYYISTGFIHDEAVRFERTVESLAFAIIGNEDVESNKNEICIEARDRIYELTSEGSAVFYNYGSAWRGSSWGQFKLHGKTFTVYFG